MIVTKMNKISVVFLKFKDSVLIIEFQQNEHLSRRLSKNILNSHWVLIFNDYTNISNLDVLSQQKRKFNNIEYELRIIASTWTFNRRSSGRIRQKRDVFFYSRHGGSQYKKWWKYDPKNKTGIQ